jgi:hypothetical protein
MIIKPVLVEITSYNITLSANDARELYSNINRLLEIAGVDFAGNRHKLIIPAIYALYDELYKVDLT